MQKFKLLLAWLDWSTFARTPEGSWKSNYEFPKSLCSLFWRTLFSVFILPVTWITHVWNRLFVSMDTFRKEDSVTHKLNIWSTLLLTLLFIGVGMGVHEYTDGAKGLGWDWFHMSDPLIISYLKVIGCGAVGSTIIAIILLVFIGIIGLIIMAFETLFSKNNSSESKSATVNAIKAIKNKYCPTIDWSSIKKQ